MNETEQDQMDQRDSQEAFHHSEQLKMRQDLEEAFYRIRYAWEQHPATIFGAWDHLKQDWSLIAWACGVNLKGK